jgi:4-hydroxyphenylpyruvate dioxygenase
MWEMPMLKSIATVCLSGSLRDKIAAIADAGFEGVEIFENDLVVSDLSPRDVRAMIADGGLVCTCYQPFRDFEGWRGGARARAFDRARRKFALMNELGAELMLVCSNVSADADGDPARLAADFAELGDIAQAAGVRVGYEALAWGAHVFDHRQAWDVVRRADHPAIGLILDSFHSLARDIPIETLRDIPGDRVFLVQIADAPAIPMDLLYWSRHFRSFPGQGDFAVAAYVGEIVRQGYAGPLSLEIFNDRFRAWSARQIAPDGMRSLVYLEDQLARQPAIRAAAPIDPRLPDRPAPRGVTFIEFAASGDGAVELTDWFGRLGFSCVGRHRSKAVTRWRQGDINLIVNQEPQGFAHAHELTHGASVCAFGIGVDSTEETMRRAVALRAKAFSQTTGPGELQIPSIRAVGGSLIYFTPGRCDERFWEVDFVPEPATDAGVGLTHIDHIQPSMPPEEFLSWQLYYTSLLATERTAPVDVVDPSGLVQSEAIESGDGAFRVTLNGAAGQTLSSRFLQRYFGAGVQHVAFVTEDIVASVAALRDRGVEFLSLPDNYYENLAAQFGLDDAFLDRLRTNGILYDRDVEGEYLQAYTRSFERRFFVELVERRGYRGYGAANAPARLAAQARFRVDAL